MVQALRRRDSRSRSHLGFGGVWKFSDWSSSVDKAKKDVIATAAEVKQKAEQIKTDMSKETASLKTDIDSSRTQLQAASQLVPEMDALRQQLAQATADIKAQQKIISSSEDFVKAVFSSHIVEIFHIGQPPAERYAILPPPSGGNRTVVFLLLKSSPIPETLQLQYHIFAQPPNSYFSLHNIVIYFWGPQSPDGLKEQQLSAFYFPDKSDKDLITALSEHDGRVFADGEPLPKLNQPDPDFPGNKWLNKDLSAVK